jgi:hypothetical protein
MFHLLFGIAVVSNVHEFPNIWRINFFILPANKRIDLHQNAQHAFHLILLQGIYANFSLFSGKMIEIRCII